MPTVHSLRHARVLWQMLVQRVSKDKWPKIATNSVAKQSFIADKRAVLLRLTRLDILLDYRVITASLRASKGAAREMFVFSVKNR